MARRKKRADGRYQATVAVEGKPKVFYGKTQGEADRKAREARWGSGWMSGLRRH